MIHSKIAQLELDLLDFKKLLIKTKPSHWVPESFIKEGQGGLSLAAKHLSTIRYNDDQLGAEVTKLPGLVLCDNPTLKAIKAINKQKDEIKSLLANARSSLTHADYVQLKTLCFHNKRINHTQTLRHIPVYSDVCNVAYFSWATGDSSRKKISADKAIEMIEDKFGESNPTKSKELIERVGNSMEPTFCYSKKMAPYVNCTLVNEEKQRKKIKAHSPIFLPLNATLPSHSKNLSDTPNTDKDGRKPRSDKTQIVEFIGELNLFVEIKKGGDLRDVNRA